MARLPRMSETERAVFAAAFAREIAMHSAADNSAAEMALDTALWDVRCFRQAVRDAGRLLAGAVVMVVFVVGLVMS